MVKKISPSLNASIKTISLTTTKLRINNSNGKRQIFGQHGWPNSQCAHSSHSYFDQITPILTISCLILATGALHILWLSSLFVNIIIANKYLLNHRWYLQQEPCIYISGCNFFLTYKRLVNIFNIWKSKSLPKMSFRLSLIQLANIFKTCKSKSLPKIIFKSSLIRLVNIFDTCKSKMLQKLFLYFLWYMKQEASTYLVVTLACLNNLCLLCLVNWRKKAKCKTEKNARV